MSVAGLLLAAGAGRRMGRPKALVHDPDGTSWLLRSVAALRPCGSVTVVLGAGAEEAAALLPMSVGRVLARDWEQGQSASLRAGLEALGSTDAEACLVLLVDLPDVDAHVVARVLAQGGEGTDVLARAAYDGAPGHPVLIGRAHWAGVLAGLGGDDGAKGYLAAHEVSLIECGDLADGHDQDTPAG